MKYLMVTIFDNDFWYHLEVASKVIQMKYRWYDSNTFTEDDIPEIKQAIKEIMIGVERLSCSASSSLGNKFNIDTCNSYFDPIVKIVDESEIEEWFNGEVYYIPLSHDRDEYGNYKYDIINA